MPIHTGRQNTRAHKKKIINDNKRQQLFGCCGIAGAIRRDSKISGVGGSSPPLNERRQKQFISRLFSIGETKIVRESVLP